VKLELEEHLLKYGKEIKKKISEDSLDELNTRTLTNYIPKAHKSGVEAYRTADYNISRAMSSEILSRPEYIEKYEKLATKNVHKAVNREKGIERASKKLKKISEEELDEISKDVLARYIPKSASEASANKFVQGKNKTWGFKSSKKLERDYKNRETGIGRAVNKMGGEDTREGKYINASAKDYGGIEYLQGRRRATGKNDDLEPLTRETNNRKRGIDTAVKKLHGKSTVETKA
jgi:hypothetical protein